MTQRIEYNGEIHEFPDSFTDQDIKNALSQHDKNPVSKDVLNSARLQEGQYIRRFGTATPDALSSPENFEASKRWGEQGLDTLEGAVRGIPAAFTEPPQTDLEKGIERGGGRIATGVKRLAEGVLNIPGQIGSDLGSGNYGGALVNAALLGKTLKSGVVDPLQAKALAKARTVPSQSFNELISPEMPGQTGVILKSVGPLLKEVQKSLGIELDPAMPTEGLKKIISAAKDKVINNDVPWSEKADVAGKLLQLEKDVNKAHLDAVPEEVPKFQLRPGMAWHPKFYAALEGVKYALNKNKSVGSKFVNFWNKWKPETETVSAQTPRAPLSAPPADIPAGSDLPSAQPMDPFEQVNRRPVPQVANLRSPANWRAEPVNATVQENVKPKISPSAKQLELMQKIQNWRDRVNPKVSPAEVKPEEALSTEEQAKFKSLFKGALNKNLEAIKSSPKAEPKLIKSEPVTNSEPTLGPILDDELADFSKIVRKHINETTVKKGPAFVNQLHKLVITDLPGLSLDHFKDALKRALNL